MNNQVHATLQASIYSTGFVRSKNTFCAQSETSIRMSRATGLLRVASQGFSQPFVKTLAAVYPDLTDRHRLQSNQQLGTNTRQN